MRGNNERLGRTSGAKSGCCVCHKTKPSNAVQVSRGSPQVDGAVILQFLLASKSYMNSLFILLHVGSDRAEHASMLHPGRYNWPFDQIRTIVNLSWKMHR
jgi:hypothetical protein